MKLAVRTSAYSQPARRVVLSCCVLVAAVVSGVILIAAGILSAADTEADAENGEKSAQAADYEKDIKPLLAKSCSACHGALKQESELRLDTRSLALRGGESGAVIVANRSSESLLIRRVNANGAERMPPEGEGEALSPEDVALLKRWIDSGAAGPDDEPVPADPRSHWAYQNPVKTEVPKVDSVEWSSNPIDAFLAAKRVGLKLTPAEPANKRTWIRRVYLDLVGLPPTRAEVDSFLADESPDARKNVVERLLESPQYGERWGRHWMDVWRYSDWSGYGNEIRNSQRHIWRWRDWIINSLNEDKAYDQMILQMLAGDEIAPDDPEVLAATGFLARNWYKFNRNVWLDATVEHTAKAFLGTTINCARCHDHKYDPISQTNYYEMRAIFEPHKTRTDQVGAEQDLTKDGLPRVYDADLKTPTYLFARGNEKHPVEANALLPGLPAVLAPRLKVEVVELPVDSYYPYLSDSSVQTRQEAALKEVKTAEQQLAAAEQQLVAKKQELANFKDPHAEPNTEPAATVKSVAAVEKPTSGKQFLVDDFSKQRDELWDRTAGDWKHENGRLVQAKVDLSRNQLRTKQNQPRDFVARLKLKIVGGNTYHSVGLSFDCRGEPPTESMQTVYLSAHSPEPKVQISHTVNGSDAYPANGKVKLGIERGGEYELEVAVRDRLMNVSVDGNLQVAYETPHERVEGKFAIWAFDCAAEFISIEICELPADVELVKSANPSPLVKKPTVVTRSDVEAEVVAAQQAIGLGELKLQRAQLSEKSLSARTAADRAKYGLDASAGERVVKFDELAIAAGMLKRQIAVVDANVALLNATKVVADAERAANNSNGKKEIDALKKAKDDLEKKQAALKMTEKSAKKPSKEYAALGTEYPRTSSGRRLAFANWIANRDNPLTARVAVNHIWLRHFGAPLVGNAFDFGLRSPPPLHQHLLDWLAVELMENNWSMKHIHQLIVTSRSYAMSSSTQLHDQNKKIDADNIFLWKMNARRLEAEVVRDAMLHVAGNLDGSMGGPAIDHRQGQASRRRSVYFRHAYEKKMKFLELFDAANETDCYRRSESVIPQQALAMSNSQLSFSQSRLLANKLWAEIHAKESDIDEDRGNEAFVGLVFQQLLGRLPSDLELTECSKFLASQAIILKDKNKLSKFTGGAKSQVNPAEDPVMRSRENLVHVIMNHNDFVTVR